MNFAKLSLALGRRTMPPRARAPAATRRALLSARTAFNREVGGIVDVNHPFAHNASVTTRFITKPKGTIFVFGGIMGGMVGLPSKKFLAMMKNARRDIVLFKDFHQSWFQNGLVGAATSRDDMEAFIHKNFGGCPQPWTFLGSNSGGFAALYFGLSFGGSKIRAFSPQTIIDAQAFDFLIQHKPEEWGFDINDPQNDLLNHPELGNPRSQVSLFYSDQSSLDFAQISRLKGTSNIDFIPIKTPKLDCVGALRQAAKLRDSVR